jgi:hypothetical protein
MRILLFFCFLLQVITSKAQCDSITTLNEAIISWVSMQVNKKVGTGECWELVRQALDHSGAKWDGRYRFGRPLEMNDCVMPGDIIQFEKVKTKRMLNNSEIREYLPHHTAIVYQVISADEIKLIHQNTGYSGKKVTISDFYFSSIKSGRYTVYRPEK